MTSSSPAALAAGIHVNEPKSEKSEVEAAVRGQLEAGALQTAATRALTAYGPEILSFLIARLKTRSDGEEVFSMFAEDLWKGLPAFGFRCSVRAWMYTLARNAANRYAVTPHQRPDRNLAVSGHPSVTAVIQQGRTGTHAFKRTDLKSKVRALRERLPLEDQTLLILHVDRGLAWRELAIVMHEKGERLDEDELTRESARLRKRFERVRSTLRELAVKEGLLKD